MLAKQAQEHEKYEARVEEQRKGWKEQKDELQRALAQGGLNFSMKLVSSRARTRHGRGRSRGRRPRRWRR